ncbi:MAG: glycosyltransferase [Anaeroplasmataceae bacterium]|nr:glycosyltransferase [Anaeroplasmataceae bacterium]
MDKIKILVFGFTNNIGGVENYYMNYYRRFDFSKFEIDFLTTANDMAYKEEVSKRGKVFVAPNFKRNPFKYYSFVNKVIKKNKYDIVHINMLSCANIIPFSVSKKNKVKSIIAHSHNAFIPKGIIRKILNFINKRKVIRYSTKLLACSNKAGKWMFGDKSHFEVIPNQIDYEKYKYNPSISESIKEKLKIEKDCFVIGHIGRFSEQKNHDFILALADKLRNETNQKFKFILIGTGERLSEITQKIEKYNLKEYFNMTGMIDNSNEYYNCFDIFILPSLFEGLPLVGIEAQFNGLKCFFSKEITKEMDLGVNGQCCFLPLDLDLWSKEILSSMQEKERFICYDEKYDIKHNVLENLYCLLQQK